MFRWKEEEEEKSAHGGLILIVLEGFVMLISVADHTCYMSVNSANHSGSRFCRAQALSDRSQIGKLS